MKIIEGFPSSMMDDYQLNVTDILLYAAKNFPNQTVVYREGENVHEYTYRDILDRVMRLANALSRMGIGAGDRVGVLDLNTHRFLELYFGIPCIGAVIVPLNPRLHHSDLIYIVNHSGIKTIFFNTCFSQLIRSMKNDRINVSNYIVLDSQANIQEVEADWRYEELLAEGEPSYEFPTIDERSAYSACYTSGTTGRPKGVYYSHRSTMIHSLVWAIHLRLSVNDVHLQLTPMYHAMGWGIWLSSMIVGAKQVLPGKWRLKDMGPIVDLIINYNVSIAEGVPTIWSGIVDELDKRGFQNRLNLRAVLGGSAPSIKLLRRLHEYGFEVIHTYGFTEGNPIAFHNVLKPDIADIFSGDELLEHLMKQGIPGFLVRSRVIDDYGNEISPGGSGIGELVVRGPYITNNYYDFPGGRDAFIELDGWRWFKSGDACVIDQDGYMRVVDRYKDLIKSGGEWISTIDMENHLTMHPYIEEACVIGVRHHKWGERPIAFIVPKKGLESKLTEESVYKHLELRFSGWQLPDKIIFVEEIPKTGTGKYMKKVLRDEYENLFNLKSR